MRLAVGHVEVRQVHDLDEVAHARIAVDDLGRGGDQADDELGEVIARRRLAAEHEHARLHGELGIGLEPVIQADDVQDVQVLALVFVDALDLHVEDRGRIDDDAGALLDQTGQRGLVGVLDLAPLGAEIRVVDQRLELAQLRTGRGSSSSPMRCVMQCARRGFDEHHPAPRRHAVGLVGELLRPQLGEVVEHVALEQLGVQRRDAVDGVAADAGQVRHAHVALAGFIDERQARDALLVAEEGHAHFVEEARVDLVDDLEDAAAAAGRTCGSGQRSSASGSSV